MDAARKTNAEQEQCEELVKGERETLLRCMAKPAPRVSAAWVMSGAKVPRCRIAEKPATIDVLSTKDRKLRTNIGLQSLA